MHDSCLSFENLRAAKAVWSDLPWWFDTGWEATLYGPDSRKSSPGLWSGEEQELEPRTINTSPEEYVHTAASYTDGQAAATVQSTLIFLTDWMKCTWFSRRSRLWNRNEHQNHYENEEKKLILGLINFLETRYFWSFTKYLYNTNVAESQRCFNRLLKCHHVHTQTDL